MPAKSWSSLNLLVAAVVEPGRRARSVYLPAGSGWYDFSSGDYYTGGQEIVLAAPWDRPPLPAKEGCAIPLNVADQHFAKPADERGFAVFPNRNEGTFECQCFEDDGESEGYREGHFWSWHLKVESNSSRIAVNLSRSGEADPVVDRVCLRFRRQETRPIDIGGGGILRERERGNMCELLVGLGSELA